MSFKISDDNHDCTIIYYHLPFNRSLKALWNAMYKYMTDLEYILRSKYVYYAKVNEGGLNLRQESCQKMRWYPWILSFDLENQICCFADGQFVAASGCKKFFEYPYPKSFFDNACMTTLGQYSVHELYDLPIVSATIFWHEDYHLLTCRYCHKYCAYRQVLMKDVLPVLKNLRGRKKELEWQRICSAIPITSQNFMKMNLQRSGSVPMLPDKHCCNYDYGWKMIMFHHEFMDNVVSAQMVKLRNEDHSHFQDLCIRSKKKQGWETDSPRDYAVSWIWVFHLRDDRKKKIKKKLLFAEMFCRRMKGMFVCNLCCIHSGVNCTVAIAKDSNGQGIVYDLNYEMPIDFSLNSLNKCIFLQTVHHKSPWEICQMLSYWFLVPFA